MEDSKVKGALREGYGKIAKQGSSCCIPQGRCCGGSDLAHDISKKIGYSEEEMKRVPEGANLGLGCGNPIALASLQEGEVVLDLGSGAGFDCFLAANKVGKKGKVIGVDMTPEMVDKARKNTRKGDYENVDIRLGEIENLPVADNSVDAVISNCVINLSTNKGRVFLEAFRVLKPGGRLMVSDIVLLGELPDVMRNSVEAYIGCLAGAILRDEYIGLIKTAGFQEVRIVDETSFSIDFMADGPSAKAVINKSPIPPETIKEAANTVRSIKVSGVKPNRI